VRQVVKEQVSPDERIRLINEYNQAQRIAPRVGGSPAPPLQEPIREIYGPLIALTNYPAGPASKTKELVFKAAPAGVPEEGRAPYPLASLDPADRALAERALSFEHGVRVLDGSLLCAPG
jgi:hypothetical protein